MHSFKKNYSYFHRKLAIIHSFNGTAYFTLREKCPYSEFIRSIFSCIRNEYGETSPYSLRMQENTDQKNSKYGHSSHSVSA